MIIPSEKATARELVTSWFLLNHESLDLSQLKSESHETPAKTLSMQLETSNYLIDITVWDHFFCLDILVYGPDSDDPIFYAAGACETAQGINDRLLSLALWLRSKRCTA